MSEDVRQKQTGLRPSGNGLRKRLPRSRALRITLGISLLFGGMLGFLPVLGFWMIPLGLAILAIDSPLIRRFWRRMSVRLERFRRDRSGT